MLQNHITNLNNSSIRSVLSGVIEGFQEHIELFQIVISKFPNATVK